MTRMVAGWGEGPWDMEPDQQQWIDAATGFRCEVRRHPEMGHWCGYVTVPDSHVLPDMNAIELDEYLDGLTVTALEHVHGGITFHEGREVGFDCCHYQDFAPGMMATNREVYRTYDYAAAECAKLARMLFVLPFMRSIHDAELLLDWLEGGGKSDACSG